MENGGWSGWLSTLDLRPWTWQPGIHLVQPRRESDSAGDRIQFRHADAMVGDEQIRPDDARHFVFESRQELKLDQFPWFAEVEPARDPFRLFALGALAVKQIDRAIKLQQQASERFQFLHHFRAEAKWSRGGPPVMSGEQAFFRQMIANESRAVSGGQFVILQEPR